MAKFIIGDIVSLKSGGPRLTVSVVDNTVITVDWFDGKEFRSNDFFEDQLQKA